MSFIGHHLHSHQKCGRIFARMMVRMLTITFGWIHAWIYYNYWYICSVYVLLSNGNGAPLTKYKYVALPSYTFSKESVMYRSVGLPLFHCFCKVNITHISEGCFTLVLDMVDSTVNYRLPWKPHLVQQMTFVYLGRKKVCNLCKRWRLSILLACSHIAKKQM